MGFSKYPLAKTMSRCFSSSSSCFLGAEKSARSNEPVWCNRKQMLWWAVLPSRNHNASHSWDRRPTGKNAQRQGNEFCFGQSNGLMMKMAKRSESQPMFGLTSCSSDSERTRPNAAKLHVEYCTRIIRRNELRNTPHTIQWIYFMNKKNIN